MDDRELMALAASSRGRSFFLLTRCGALGYSAISSGRARTVLNTAGWNTLTSRRALCDATPSDRHAPGNFSQSRRRLHRRGLDAELG